MSERRVDGAGLSLRQSRLPARSISARLAQERTSALPRAVEELRVRRVMVMRPADARRVRARVLVTGRAPRTVNVRFDRLRAAFNWALAAGLIAAHPTARLVRLPDGHSHQAERRRAMSDVEIERFSAAAQADDRENERGLAMSVARGLTRERRTGGVRIPQAPPWRFLIETACRYGGAWERGGGALGAAAVRRRCALHSVQRQPPPAQPRRLPKPRPWSASAEGACARES